MLVKEPRDAAEHAQRFRQRGQSAWNAPGAMLDAKLGSGPVTCLAMSPDGAKGDGRAGQHGCSRGAGNAADTRPAGTRQGRAHRRSSCPEDAGRASAARRAPPTTPRPTRGRHHIARTTSLPWRPPLAQEHHGPGPYTGRRNCAPWRAQSSSRNSAVAALTLFQTAPALLDRFAPTRPHGPGP